MTKVCDHTSVGVVISDLTGKIALLKRANFPYGMAPPAGHKDDHGSLEQAACDEVREEIGITIGLKDLEPTGIKDRRVDLSCKRPDGSYHNWTVFAATVDDRTLLPSSRETDGANWYSQAEIQKLADLTKVYLSGKISDEAWRQNPGLEEVWLTFFKELTIVR